MRFRRDILVWVFCGCVLTLLGIRAAGSLSSDSPYQGIVDRNVFDLKPPPAPGSDEPPPPPPPKITLSGITTILGARQVIMKAQLPPKPPEPAREKSYLLSEGDSEDDITVLAIDVDAGTVKVNNHGVLETLDIVKNGTKLPSAAAGNPGAPPMPTFPGTAPGAPPFPPLPAPGAAPGLQTIPQRPLRTMPARSGTYVLPPPRGGQTGQ